jgi:peroxiredoxin Q/BCP
MTLDTGDTAPALDLATDGGGRTAITGRKAVVYFYPKDDTSGCTKEGQEFTALAADFAAAGVEVIGVSKDSVASHAKFRSKYDLGVTLASDPDGAACEAWGVWVEKSMYGRKYMGIERATFLVGADGRIARAWHKVKVPGHAAEVLAAARGL